MWKKPVGKYHSQQLKGKESKNVKKALQKAYGISDECAASLISNKDTLQLWKFELDFRIYAVDGVPLVIDAGGKLAAADMYPTLFALWKVPTLLPSLMTFCQASEFIFNGADLMIPGVLWSLPNPGHEFKKDELRVLVGRGNPKGYAIGVTIMDSQTALKQKKGKVLQILHYFGDTLYQEGAKGCPPPPGFTPRCIMPVEGPTAADDTDSDEDEVKGSPSRHVDPVGQETPAEEQGEVGYRDDSDDEDGNFQAVDCGAGSEASGDEGSESESEEEKKGKRHQYKAEVAKRKAEKEKKGKGKGKNKGGDGGGSVPKVSQEEMDDLVLYCFTRAIMKITKPDLPILVSNFVSQWLLPERPESSVVDLKHSSFKKVGNLMNAMAEKGVVRLKQKSEGVDLLVEMNKTVPYFVELKRRYAESSGPSVADAKAAAAAAAEAEAANTDVLPGGRVLKVEERLRPVNDPSVMSIFGDISKDETYTRQEVAEVLSRYIAEKQVKMKEDIKGGRGKRPDPIVFPDATLSKLWKGSAERELHISRATEKSRIGMDTKMLNITGVAEGGPADQAGVRVGDTVVRVNGKPVTAQELGPAFKEAGADFTITVKGQDLCPEKVHLSELEQRLIRNMTVRTMIHYSHIPTVVCRTRLRPIRIQTDIRAGNKVVTIITRLEQFGFHLEPLCMELQRKFASSATVPPTPIAGGKNSAPLYEVVMQGGHIKKLALYLQQCYGIPSSCVEAWDRATEKKNKQKR